VSSAGYQPQLPNDFNRFIDDFAQARLQLHG
jgi:hypothetical protein